MGGGAEPSFYSRALGSRSCSILGPRGEEVGKSVPEARDKEEKEMFWSQNWARSWTGWEKPALGPNIPTMVLEDF